MSSQLRECAEETPGKGYVVSCLVDHRGNITEYQCHQYITKMTAIIYSDYRLICGFMEDCRVEINTLKCGSIRPGEKVRADTTAAMFRGVKGHLASGGRGVEEAGHPRLWGQGGWGGGAPSPLLLEVCNLSPDRRELWVTRVT